MTQTQIKQMARDSADEAVKNLDDYSAEMYTDPEEAIYSVSGLANEILDTFNSDEEFKGMKPNKKIFDQLAFDLVLL